MKNPINYFLHIAFFFGFNISYAQVNLVPNPSFENFTGCPNSLSQINFASPWITPSLGSPDYYNSCGTANFSTPVNWVGVENPRTGDAYAGFLLFGILPMWSTTYREYIQAPLDSVLIKGEVYCVEFYVSLADSVSGYAVNNIGAYFSSTPVSDTSYDPLPYTPQIINQATNPLTNMVGWTKITEQFVAQGGEQYITIGNYNDNITSDTVFINKSSSIFGPNISYYYIDDISVMHIDADAGNDTAICQGNSVMIGRAANVGLSYNWQPSTGLSDTSIAQPIASPTVTTTYYLTATLNGGCTKQDTITVAVVSVNAGNDTTLCEGIGLILGTQSLTSLAYTWQPTLGLNNSSIAQPIATLTTTTTTTTTTTITTTYTVTASANGCTQTDDVSITILPYQTPLANAGTVQTICLGDTVSIGATATAGYKYAWSPITNLSDATNSQPFAFPQESTLYHLTVTDTVSVYLCKTSGKDSILITIEQCTVEIPNVFTPNNDGINDEFIITNLPKGSNVYVYNRWGLLVYQSYLFGEIGGVYWEGRTTAGLLCIEGTYYYVISLPDGETYKGFLELVR